LDGYVDNFRGWDFSNGTNDPMYKAFTGHGTQVSGIVEELFVEAGQQVKAGQMIAKIRIVPDVVSVNNAETNLQTARINFNNAKTELARQESLYKDKVISEQEYRRFKVEYDSAINQVVINAQFYDNYGNIILRVDNNIYQTSADTWDVQMEGKTITFREALRQKVLEVILDGEKNEITILGKIYFAEGRYLDLNKKGIQCHGYTLMSNCVIDMFLIAQMANSARTDSSLATGANVW
ncbi:MAG: biotin/lipoyl-binding protein, partial [Moraxellaceae bacterium]